MCCRMFSREAITTCFYALGLSRLGFEHLAFPMQVVGSNEFATAAASSYDVNSVLQSYYNTNMSFHVMSCAKFNCSTHKLSVSHVVFG